VPGGGGGGGGSGLVATVANYGRTGGISGGAGGVKPKLRKPVYSKGTEVIPEPATGVLLVLGSLFAFARRGAKNRP